MKVKTKHTVVIFIVVFLIFEHYNIIQKQKRFPEREAFQLDVQCEEGLKSGDTGVIFASLENWGEGDYYLNYSDLFTVYMDGKQITPQNDGTDSWMLDSGDEVSESYEFVAGKPGKHSVEVKTSFYLENDAGDVKEYHYQKNCMIKVEK